MFSASWFYLYGVGGLIYVIGAVLCIRAGTLDWSSPPERRLFLLLSIFLLGFAGVHALFQFVLPFVG